ncbi:MAG: Asp-tRNA(Asn)/Glu-tRNA(Gln) amidotransferase subunit GatB [Parachlamydiales bacterium]
MKPVWETVIGLEIHAQLNTKSKIFSPAPNRFGDEPNTNISVVCTGQPGALPVLNKEAVRKAVQFGCAIGAHIPLFSKFDRKSYFYPDSPRNFQITQFDEPILIGGQVVADVEGEEMTFTIEHAHLEDDAGMLKHFSSFAGIDYNRAGAPLLEIVSDPCMHTPKEASAYGKAVKAILEYVGASDCNMEEGQFRMDINVSVRPFGDPTLRPKAEIKNMNSFTFLELALESEVKRQIRLYEQHPDKAPEEVMHSCTLRFDPNTGETKVMRRKEAAADYRYFPEPDLPPLILTQPYIDKIREALPELPYDRKKRYVEELGLTPYTAGILTTEKHLADYFEEALSHCKAPKQLANWITVEFFGRLKESATPLYKTAIAPAHIGKLVALIQEGTITGRLAKQLADEMVASPADPETIIEAKPEIYKPVSDLGEIEVIVDKVLADNPQSVADFQAGKAKAFGFLVGQVMKATQGKAAPDAVNELLKKKLG